MTKQTSIIKYIFGTLILAVVVFAVVLTAQGKGFNQGASFYKISDMKKAGGTAPLNVTPANVNLANVIPCPATGGTPIVQVISPNGGETFTAGQQITVKWGTCNIPTTHRMRIDLNISGTTMAGLTQTINDGSETVTLPTTSSWNQMVYGNNFKITIWDVDSGAVSAPSDQSNNLFVINAAQASCTSGDPLITLIDSPITGGTLNRGGNMTVSWKWCNIHPESEVLVSLKQVSSNQRYLLSTYNYSTVFPGSSTGNYQATTFGGSDLVTIPSYIPAGQYEVWVGGKVYPNWNPDFVQVTGAFTVQ
jgi:hypothetical protein